MTSATIGVFSNIKGLSHLKVRLKGGAMASYAVPWSNAELGFLRGHMRRGNLDVIKKHVIKKVAEFGVIARHARFGRPLQF